MQVQCIYCEVQNEYIHTQAYVDHDGWTEHLVLPFAQRPTNAQGSSWRFVNTFQIFYPDMFRHTVAILRGVVSAW
jgi:hypothetical protein